MYKGDHKFILYYFLFLRIKKKKKKIGYFRNVISICFALRYPIEKSNHSIKKITIYN